MEFFADWHTHSTYSDGRGTIEENIQAAFRKGLKEVAITDHGPANIGVGVKGAETYLEIHNKIREYDLKYDEITVKSGAEADIIGLDGTIDIPKSIAGKLDILIVGLHPYVWPAKLNAAWSVVAVNQLALLSRRFRQRARVNNTKALKEALYKYDVNFVSHPNLKMPVEISEIARACAEQDTALEINTGHHYDKEELVYTSLREGVNFTVNSDAHFPETVGNLTGGMELMEKFNVPVDRILNARET